MKFGTLQSLKKESPPTGAGSDEEETFDFGAGEGGATDDDSEFSMDDFGSEGGEEGGEGEGLDGDVGSSIIDKLLSLRDEIEEILSDMGYADEGDSFDSEGEEGLDGGEFGEEGEGDPDAEFGDEQDPKAQSELRDGNSEFGDSEGGEPQEEDPDFQGDIRTVKGADLVYKRKQEDGNYEELWIYNVGTDIRTETQIRKAILAGTDIVPQQRESDDGSQHCDTYTVGNVQYLRIFGLPN